MDLYEVDNAIKSLCDQISDQKERVCSECTTIESANASGAVMAELGNALAALLTARRSYGTK